LRDNHLIKRIEKILSFHLEGPHYWTTTADTAAVSGFSATCLLFARYLTDNFPTEKVIYKPMDRTIY